MVDSKNIDSPVMPIFFFFSIISFIILPLYSVMLFYFMYSYYLSYMFCKNFSWQKYQIKKNFHATMHSELWLKITRQSIAQKICVSSTTKIEERFNPATCYQNACTKTRKSGHSIYAFITINVEITLLVEILFPGSIIIRKVWFWFDFDV